MGRSVSTPSGARVVAFSSFNDEGGDFDFGAVIDWYGDQLRAMFPSVEQADDWLDREDHVVAENRLARFGISEYCGLVAYWIVPQNERHWAARSREQLADRWIDSIADRFTKVFGTLEKLGNMSNGEGVYRRIG